MSRQYSNRSFIPANNNSSRRSQNDFSHFQYPSHRQINPNFNRITVKTKERHCLIKNKILSI